MKSDLPQYLKIYNALLPRAQTSDRGAISGILCDFLSDVFSVSDDRIANPGFVMKKEYFKKGVLDREATIGMLEKLISELTEQSSNLYMAYGRCDVEEKRLEGEEKMAQEQKKSKKDAVWNTQKSIPCGSERVGISSKVKKSRTTTKKEGKALSKETTPAKSSGTLSTGP